MCIGNFSSSIYCICKNLSCSLHWCTHTHTQRLEHKKKKTFSCHRFTFWYYALGNRTQIHTHTHKHKECDGKFACCRLRKIHDLLFANCFLAFISHVIIRRNKISEMGWNCSHRDLLRNVVLCTCIWFSFSNFFFLFSFLLKNETNSDKLIKSSASDYPKMRWDRISFEIKSWTNALI